jgi:hypothetical protein
VQVARSGSAVCRFVRCEALLDLIADRRTSARFSSSSASLTGRGQRPAPDEQQTKIDSTAPCGGSSPARSLDLERAKPAQPPSGPCVDSNNGDRPHTAVGGLTRPNVWSSTLVGITTRTMRPPRDRCCVEVGRCLGHPRL